jgi:hypothetical protein
MFAVSLLRRLSTRPISEARAKRSKRKDQRFRPQLESLDDRIVPAVYEFEPGGALPLGGNPGNNTYGTSYFTNGANWGPSFTTAPGTGDTIDLPAPKPKTGTYTLDIPAGNYATVDIVSSLGSPNFVGTVTLSSYLEVARETTYGSAEISAPLKIGGGILGAGSDGAGLNLYGTSTIELLNESSSNLSGGSNGPVNVSLADVYIDAGATVSITGSITDD